MTCLVDKPYVSPSIKENWEAATYKHPRENHHWWMYFEHPFGKVTDFKLQLQQVSNEL